MPNHVHLLEQRRGEPIRALRLTGRSFWQEESYDRWIRDEREFRRIQAYIEENPVRAGLAPALEDYPWSSASRFGGAGLKPGAA